MNIQYFLGQIAILAAGGIITVSVGWYLIRNSVQQYRQSGGKNAGKEDQTQLLALRLQAHERMILFIDRLNPANLFIRLNEPGIPAAVLQRVILNEIRSEYQHNVSQQLYINAKSWTILCRLKEDTIAMINNAAALLTAEASGTDLSKLVLAHMGEMEQDPYELTLGMIKQDIHQLF
jgi:hypothetical protein